MELSKRKELNEQTKIYFTNELEQITKIHLKNDLYYSTKLVLAKDLKEKTKQNNRKVQLKRFNFQISAYVT